MDFEKLKKMVVIVVVGMILGWITAEVGFSMGLPQMQCYLLIGAAAVAYGLYLNKKEENEAQALATQASKKMQEYIEQEVERRCKENEAL